jgi:hypothetical protein
VDAELAVDVQGTELRIGPRAAAVEEEK